MPFLYLCPFWGFVPLFCLNFELEHTKPEGGVLPIATKVLLFWYQNSMNLKGICSDRFLLIEYSFVHDRYGHVKSGHVTPKNPQKVQIVT